ncbi:MAG: cyclodeaminase/cyclohydrolase family protein [Bacteroidota bacterium]|nr:cyclodeaminase/cyclohydrolase family protein [Bacteroidota bacterium]
MNIENTLKDYLDDLSSNSPTPGGGNVAALCGVLSSCLGIMVSNLTIGKKKYLSVEEEMKSVKVELEKYKVNFIELANKDNAAFDKVMEAFKLPKETDDEKRARSEQIESATLEAARVPAEVLSKCSALPSLIKIIAEKGNQNSLSDAGVAASLIQTAAQGAFFNVLINCKSLNNNNEADKLLANSLNLIESIKAEVSFIIFQITESLNK